MTTSELLELHIRLEWVRRSGAAGTDTDHHRPSPTEKVKSQGNKRGEARGVAPPPEGEGCAQLPTTPFGRGPWNLGTLEGLGGVNNRAKQQANCACPTAISSHNQQAPSRQTVAPSSSTNALEPTGPASATSTFAPCALQPPRFSPLTRHAYDCACDPSPVQDRLHPNPSSPKTSTPSHNFRIPPHHSSYHHHTTINSNTPAPTAKQDPVISRPRFQISQPTLSACSKRSTKKQT